MNRNEKLRKNEIEMKSLRYFSSIDEIVQGINSYSTDDIPM